MRAGEDPSTRVPRGESGRVLVPALGALAGLTALAVAARVLGGRRSPA
jgi:hypothetical protein